MKKGIGDSRISYVDSEAPAEKLKEEKKHMEKMKMETQQEMEEKGNKHRKKKQQVQCEQK